jgi:hypothetical protein
MIRFSLSDLYSLWVMAKYKDPWRASPSALGEEYAEFLLIQAIAKEKVVPAHYIACHFPFTGFRALHFAYQENLYVVLYESVNDDIIEQLKSRLHEAGEILNGRLRRLWPSYAAVSEIEDVILGDSWADIFAETAVRRWLSIAGKLTTMCLDSMDQVFSGLVKFSNEFVREAWQACKPFQLFVLAYLVESAAGTRTILGDIGRAVVDFLQAVAKLILEIWERGCQAVRQLITSFSLLMGEYAGALIA